MIFEAKVHPGKQGKYIQGHPNYQKGKSIFTGNAQRLLDEYAGTGQKIGSNKERVNFKQIIGKWVDLNTGEAFNTTKGIIIRKMVLILSRDLSEGEKMNVDEFIKALLRYPNGTKMILEWKNGLRIQGLIDTSYETDNGLELEDEGYEEYYALAVKILSVEKIHL